MISQKPDFPAFFLEIVILVAGLNWDLLLLLISSFDIKMCSSDEVKAIVFSLAMAGPFFEDVAHAVLGEESKNDTKP